MLNLPTKEEDVLKIPFKKKYYNTIKHASLMEVDQGWAVECRMRFLNERIVVLRKGLFFKCNEITEAFIDRYIKKAVDEITYLEERKIKETSIDGRVTDADIESARNVPIDSIIEFTHRRAIAWCHSDTNPSLMHLTRINKAMCYPCQKYFSSIDAYMHIFGVGFIDAVKSLRN